MYKYILLDWDGCLIKSLDPWLEVYKELLTERNLPVPNDKTIVDKSFGKWAQGLAALGIGDSDVAYEHAKQKIADRYIKAGLYEGALDLLKFLKQNGKKVALLSSSSKQRVLAALKHENLEKYFDFVITKDDVQKGKPDPEIFLKALENLGGNKYEAIVIGDSYHDIQGGKNAGIKTVAFYPKENEKFYTLEEVRKEKPDYFIRKLSELVDIV